MRNLPIGTLNEMSAAQQRYVHLLDIALDGNTVRLTDDISDVTLGINTYMASGHFLDFQHDGDGDGMNINTLTVTLSGVDQALISATLQYSFLGRRLTLWRAYFDAAGTMQTPFTLFDGRCDGPLTEDDPDSGKCTIQVRASNHFVDFERVRGRLTNHEAQQVHFPGDMGFEFVSQLNKELQWGGT